METKKLAFWKELVRQYKPDKYQKNPYFISFRPEDEYEWNGDDFTVYDAPSQYRGEPVLAIHIYDKSGQMIDILRVNIPERNAEFVRRIRDYCSTCKTFTENNVVYSWISRLHRYSTATEMVCINCGSHWDYLVFGINKTHTLSNGK
jgi:hypothetical protein